MKEGTLATDSTTVKIGVVELIRMAIAQLIRFPVATFVAIALSGLLGWILSGVSVSGFLATAMLFVGGSIASIILVMAMIALRVLDEDDLEHLGRVVQISLVFAVTFGTVASLPLIVAAYFVPEATWSKFMVGYLPDQVPFLFASLGAVLMVGIMPAMLVAWPVVARHNTGLMQSIGYVWQWIENQRYNARQITVGVAGTGALLCFVPYVSVLVIPLLMSVSVVLFDVVSEDIIVKDE